jgi:hypothetical protein
VKGKEMHVIDTKLQALTCPLTAFCEICTGIISRPTLTSALKGQRVLDRNIENRLLELLNDMAELRQASPVAVDWSDSAGIRALIEASRAIKKARDWDGHTVRNLWEAV